MKNSKLIKILVVAPYFYPKIGGVEGHIYNLYTGIIKKGNYDITVLTTKFSQFLKDEDYVDGLKVIRLPYQFKISNTPVSFNWNNEIKRMIEEINPDIIMAHSPVPFLADLTVLSSKKVPVILKYHSGSLKKEKGFFTNLILSIYEKYILPIILNKVTYLICTSDFVRNKFLSAFKFKSVTITPGVNIDKFKPKTTGTKNFKTVLFVGRIDKTSMWKGLKYLLDAFKQVIKIDPEVRLSIIGAGDDLQSQIDYSKKLDIFDKINFLGELRGEKLVEGYQKSTLLVLPSITESESFGMVLVEAMACKIPVIGSNVGGIPYVIDNGKNGLLVPSKNPQALAEAILKILANPDMAKKMGKNGFDKVLKYFTWDTKVEETIEVINSVLDKTK